MFEAPVLANTHQWHRSKQQIKTSHTPCRRTISHAPTPEAYRRHRIKQQFKTNGSPLDARFCKHAVYDNDDLTPCSKNPLGLASTDFPALFSGVYRSSSKSIRGKSKACRNAYRSFGRTDCFSVGSHANWKHTKMQNPCPCPSPWCLAPKGRECGCSNISQLIRSLHQNGNGTWTSSQESIKANPQIDSVRM